MKSYKEYPRVGIGSSDIAALIMVGCGKTELKTDILKFGEDGRYLAYIVDENANIGPHYELVAEYTHWIKIYDDDGLTYDNYAELIRVWRAGDCGCIIQLIDFE